MDTLGTTLTILDYAGVAVFAATGALAAARRGHTMVTFLFFAAVTGTGGGTLRDLLIGAPVFWIQQNAYLVVCFGVAALTWVLRVDRWHFRTLLWLDAIGLAVYPVIGAAKALAYGVPPLAAVVMGTLTGCFGGIVRDVLAEEPSILLRPEIYVSAAILAAAVFVLLDLAGMPAFEAGIIGATAGFILRAGALRYGWALPAYRAKE